MEMRFRCKLFGLLLGVQVQSLDFGEKGNLIFLRQLASGKHGGSLIQNILGLLSAVATLLLAYISNWKRRENSNNNFSAFPPYDTEQKRGASKELLDDFTVHNQRMNRLVLTLMVTADTKEQLDSDTKSILTRARQKICQMIVLIYR